MTARFEVPADTLRKQALVSDPAVSAWVTANAGAGKTTVLVRRVVRLLLAGNPPARILCLTFTKAAAANMANKVLETLSRWVRLDDESLDRAIREVSPIEPSPALRDTARRLFAQALESPGGLKVQTIHAFCDRVLHQFPFEAGVQAGFEVLDEVREADLLKRARQSVLIEASNNPAGELGRALAHAVAVATDMSLEEALDEAVRERGKIARLNEIGGETAVAEVLGLQPGDTARTIESEILNHGHLARGEWAAVGAALAQLDGNAAACGKKLAEAAAIADDDAALEAYLSVFFTKEGGPRADSGFGTAAVRNTQPNLFARIFAERDRLILLRDRLFATRAWERTGALLMLASATIERFETSKRAQGVLDYADLIDKTADMFERTGSSWVLYKLDGGIDHVLIDEAQDTSPEQWNVIARLTADFFAGKGARDDRPRTIFAVGDEKQSIFSFQGADPREFERMKREFERRVLAAQLGFEPLMLDLSFRSAVAVLGAIDKVFERPDAFRGLSFGDEKKTAHTAIRRKAPALVEIWPTEKPDTAEDEGLAWDAPLNARSEASPVVRLAQKIAAAVKFWTEGGLAIADRDTGELRVPRAGDVIVLVRRRGPLFEAILQALKRADVAVAGADRLILSEHIAVMDLMALGDALTLEQDELALASVLKSPLFRLDENDLFALAHERRGTLAAALVERAKTEKRFGDAAEKFLRWRAEASALRPFDFYSRVLGRDNGREQMLSRLGMEAADALDEFLARALSYEQTEAPSLVGFLSFLRRAGTEVKRDLEVESDAVRVMTAHGAKGLEAPLVILADTTSMPDGKHDDKLLRVPESDVLIWGLNRTLDSTRLREAREAATELRAAEYRRLLYVALTRAADALIVCGHEGRNKLNESCWYRLVLDALDDELVKGAAPGFDGTVLRWRPEEHKAAAQAATAAIESGEIPSWLGTRAPPSPPAPTRVSPSQLDPDDERVSPFAKPAAHALDPRQRGDLLHRLLQRLPEIPAGERKASALRFLGSVAHEVAEPEREKMADEAIRVIAHPDLRELFGADSRAEVDFLAHLPAAGGQEILGRIDRLAVTKDCVLIADFKTGKPPAGQDAPGNYLRQLAIYRDVLARTYSGRAMRALLVWTDTGTIQEIAAESLNAAYTSQATVTTT
jgi:ATP-dependent helicase/nuclease subunit A